MFKRLLPALGLALMSLLTTGPTAQAQALTGGARPCGFDEQQQQYFATHPGAQKQYQDFLQQVAADFAANGNNQQRTNIAPDVTVPHSSARALH